MTRTKSKIALKSLLIAFALMSLAGLLAVRLFDGSWLPFKVEGALLSAKRLVWSEDAGGNGGLSGVDRNAEGQLITISDDGLIYWSDIQRDPSGQIDRLALHWVTKMPSEWDNNSPYRRDAEDIAVGENGEIFISWEGDARITRQSDPIWFQHDLHTADRFRMINGNTGFEAMAYQGNERLIIIPEKKPVFEKLLLLPQAPHIPKEQIPMLRLTATTEEALWDIEYIGKFALSEGWRITGADWYAKNLWILKNRLTPFGFENKVCVISGDFKEENIAYTVLTILPGRFGNAEGLDVKKEGDAISVIIVADNDHSWLRKTVLAEIMLSTEWNSIINLKSEAVRHNLTAC